MCIALFSVWNDSHRVASGAGIPGVDDSGVDAGDDVDAAGAALGGAAVFQNHGEPLHLALDVIDLHEHLGSALEGGDDFPVLRAEDFADGRNFHQAVQSFLSQIPASQTVL